MALVFAATSAMDFNLSGATLVDDSLDPTRSRPHCGRSFILAGSSNTFLEALPVADAPTTGTIMFTAKLSTDGVGSPVVNQHFLNSPNFAFGRTTALDTIAIIRRSRASFERLGTLVIPGCTTTLKQYILQYTPTRARLSVDGVEMFDSGEVPTTTETHWPITLRGPGQLTVAAYAYFSEFTVHDTLEPEFFPCRAMVLSETSRSGFTGSFDELSKVTSVSPMVADAVGAQLVIGLTPPAGALPAGTGDAVAAKLTTRWGSSLEPKKLKSTLAGTTPAFSVTELAQSTVAYHRYALETSTTPTSLTLDVEAT